MMLHSFIKELLECLARELSIEENKQKLRATLAAPLIPYIRFSMSILVIVGVLTLLNMGLTTYMFRHFQATIH